MTGKQFHSSEPKQLPRMARKDAVKLEFSRRLQREMTRRDWTQSELARRANIGRDNISNYIRGKTLPRQKHLSALARALEREPSHLLPALPVGSLDKDLPQFEIKDIGDSLVLLRLNQTLPFHTAVKIAELVSNAQVRDQ